MMFISLFAHKKVPVLRTTAETARRNVLAVSVATDRQFLQATFSFAKEVPKFIPALTSVSAKTTPCSLWLTALFVMKEWAKIRRKQAFIP